MHHRSLEQVASLKDAAAFGRCLQHQPLRTLKFWNIDSNGVVSLLHTLSMGEAVQSLKTLEYSSNENVEDGAAVIAAIIAFKRLETLGTWELLKHPSREHFCV